MPVAKNSREGNIMMEQYLGRVSDSVKMVFDLTSRIDERVKMLVERQKEIDEQIDKLLEMQNSSLQRMATVESVLETRDYEEHLKMLSEKVAILSRVEPELQREVKLLRQKNHELINDIHVIKMKVEAMGAKQVTHDSRWGKVMDGMWKVALMLIASYILYKLGIQAPGH